MYYVISEALANVAKHSGAAVAEVRAAVTRDGSFELTVRDHGIGGATRTDGGGLLALSDRGRLTLTSRRGNGTTLRTTLPLTDG